MVAHARAPATLAVDAVMRIRKHLNLEHIHIIKKPGGSMRDSYLDEGFLLDKKIGVGQPKRLENAKIMVANTSMDTDKIKVRLLHACVRVWAGVAADARGERSGFFRRHCSVTQRAGVVRSSAPE